MAPLNQRPDFRLTDAALLVLLLVMIMFFLAYVGSVVAK